MQHQEVVPTPPRRPYEKSRASSGASSANSITTTTTHITTRFPILATTTLPREAGVSASGGLAPFALRRLVSHIYPRSFASFLDSFFLSSPSTHPSISLSLIIQTFHALALLLVVALKCTTWPAGLLGQISTRCPLAC